MRLANGGRPPPPIRRTLTVFPALIVAAAIALLSALTVVEARLQVPENLELNRPHPASHYLNSLVSDGTSQAKQWDDHKPTEPRKEYPVLVSVGDTPIELNRPRATAFYAMSQNGEVYYRVPVPQNTWEWIGRTDDEATYIQHPKSTVVGNLVSSHHQYTCAAYTDGRVGERKTHLKADIIQTWDDLKDMQNKFNQNPDSEGVIRQTFMTDIRDGLLGHFRIDPKKHSPLNPIGPTGIEGKGELPRWGPNIAVDTLITRDAYEVIDVEKGDRYGWVPSDGVEETFTVSSSKEPIIKTIKTKEDKKKLIEKHTSKGETISVEVTREEPDKNGNVIDTKEKVKKKEWQITGYKVLQMVAIVRGDANQHAIPGGFINRKEVRDAEDNVVDWTHESVKEAAKRKFRDEAMRLDDWEGLVEKKKPSVGGKAKGRPVSLSPPTFSTSRAPGLGSDEPEHPLLGRIRKASTESTSSTAAPERTTGSDYQLTAEGKKKAEDTVTDEQKKTGAEAHVMSVIGDKWAIVEDIFDADYCREVYLGYAEDPRNTDNAWVETIVMHCHDRHGRLKDDYLRAGLSKSVQRGCKKDVICSGVTWVTIQPGMAKFYASHPHFIRLAAARFELKVDDWWYPPNVQGSWQSQLFLHRPPADDESSSSESEVGKSQPGHYIYNPVPKPRPKPNICDTPIELSRPRKPTHYTIYTNPTKGQPSKERKKNKALSKMPNLDASSTYTVVRVPVPDAVREGRLWHMWNQKHENSDLRDYAPTMFTDPQVKWKKDNGDHGLSDAQGRDPNKYREYTDEITAELSRRFNSELDHDDGGIIRKTYCHASYDNSAHTHGELNKFEMMKIPMEVDKHGVPVKGSLRWAPLNPMGPTGIQGKGINRRWGAGHAVDALLTRIVDEWEVQGENGKWTTVAESIGTDKHSYGPYAGKGEVMCDHNECQPLASLDQLEREGKAKKTGRQVLQFVVIIRRDRNQHAIPGGFIDPDDENVGPDGKKQPEPAIKAARREFKEETMNLKTVLIDLNTCKEEKPTGTKDNRKKPTAGDIQRCKDADKALRMIDDAWKVFMLQKAEQVKQWSEHHIKPDPASESCTSPKGLNLTDDGQTALEACIEAVKAEAKKLAGFFCVPIYLGYVDDPRNTDNAWMETRVMHCHVPKTLIPDAYLQGGDDATEAKWKTVEPGMAKLYASHPYYLKLGAARFDIDIADWWFPPSVWS